MHQRIREYSQWFLGSNNKVADALSGIFDRTDNKLTRILFTHDPSKIPPTFKIVPLTNEITSWVTLLQQKLPVLQQYNKAHKMSMLGFGNDGKNTANM
jgi:hypothetical protein